MHKFSSFSSSGLVPSHNNQVAARRGAGNFFEVVSHMFYESNDLWPVVKVATAVFANDDSAACVGLMEKSIESVSGNFASL